MYRTISPRITFGAALAALIVLASSPSSAADVRTGNIVVRGVKADHCWITVVDDGATLDLETSTAATGTKIGHVIQNCNKKAGYTLKLSSTNCTTDVDGAKLASGPTTIPTEYLNYSIRVAPNGGGTQPIIASLLDNGCDLDADVLARDVSNEKINNEQTNVYAVYSANPALSADTYTDVLRITMTVN
jgi:spore coat protein U-like protein